MENDSDVYRILLLTNRDSDNVGDQLIEVCNISLISAVMENLGIGRDKYMIDSRAGSIVSKYVDTRDPVLLDKPRKLIRDSDLIIFGGAPIFNFDHQLFYERTAVTLELAREYHKPVLFSAVGTEDYNEKDKKCQRLKKTLNFDCVKQITTRDDLERLQKFKNEDNAHLVLGKVADPAIFVSRVLCNFRATPPKGKEKIGLIPFRASGFTDNKVDFSRDDALAFWKGLIDELQDKGYDYELLTSGHFADEAFLDLLVRKYKIDAKKAVFNMNMPEELIRHISSCSAVVSCRLHPSIISFSLGVPSLGIFWNPKVESFYSGIGHEDRIIYTEDIDPKKVVERLQKAMEEGVSEDSEYRISVYTYLFEGIKRSLCGENCDAVPYTYEELISRIPAYEGTSEEEQAEKIKRKLRRIYKTYNTHYDTRLYLQNDNDMLRAELKKSSPVSSARYYLKKCYRHFFK